LRISKNPFNGKIYILLLAYYFTIRTLIDFSIFQEYNEKVLPRGDRLLALEKLMDWYVFSSLLNLVCMEANRPEKSYKITAIPFQREHGRRGRH
jgi:hypothetical protein